MNIDGSARLDDCTGGGIIRDNHGKMVMALSNYYGPGSNNFAEFAALRDGLHMCQALGITRVMIESDSMIVVKAIRSRRVTSWSLEYIFRQCLAALWSTSLNIDHLFRRVVATDFFLPFELISIILLVALIGAIAIARQ